MKKTNLFTVMIALASLILLSTCDLITLTPMEELDYTLQKEDLVFENFQPRHLVKTQDLNFSWDSSPEIQLFHLQVADNSSFTGDLLIDNNQISSNNYNPNLNQGTYFWRVCFFYNGKWQDWSEIQRIRVIDAFKLDFEDSFSIDFMNLSGDSQPFTQQYVAYNGSQALQFGNIGNNESSSASLNIEVPTGVLISFAYKVSSENNYDKLRFYINGTSVMSKSGEEDWDVFSYYIPEAGSYTLKWVYSKDDLTYRGADTAWLDDIEWFQIETENTCDLGFENVDGTGPDMVTFQYSGYQLPYIQSIEHNQGSNALCFGELEIHQESVAELTLELSEESVIAFESRVDSYGDLYFYIDYVEGDSSIYSNSVDSWEIYTSTLIPAGTHTFRWRYYQDNTQYSGDTAWLDNINIIPVVTSNDCDLGFENVDGTGTDIVTFNYSGDRAPYIQSIVKNQGSNSLCFGELENGEESIAELTLELTEDSLIAFESKVDSYGYLYFHIDDEDGDNSLYSNSNDSWQNYTSTLIPAGTHTFRWRYYQGSSQYSGDTAWLDNINIIPVVTSNDCDLGFENVDGTGTDIVTFNYSGEKIPYIQSIVKNQGSNALCFGELSVGEESIAELTLELTEGSIISFDSKVDSYGYLYFYIDYDELDSHVYSNTIDSWQNYNSTLIPAGIHTFRWRYFQNATQYSGDTAWLDNISVYTLSMISSVDFEAANALDSLTLSGAALPFLQTVKSHTGAQALQFGDITHSQSSSVEIVVETTVETTISFAYSVSSESNYDGLTFYINDTIQMQEVTGTHDWQIISYDLPALGTYTLKWTYSKDGSVDRGEDTAWLDDIIIYEKINQ